MLQETGLVVLVSLTVAILIGAALGALRTFLPRHTPQIAVLLSKGGAEYGRDHLAYLSEWGAGLLIIGVLAGYAFGLLAASMARGREGTGDKIRFVSAWYQVLHDVQRKDFPDCLTHVGCRLDDGSWIGGYLRSFSADLDETGDRDLVLGRPITHRPKDGDEEVRPDATVIVSARRIVDMEIHYVEEARAADSPPSPPSAAAQAEGVRAPPSADTL